MSLDIELKSQQDTRLGRQMVHDTESRRFALPMTVDRSSWHDRSIRLYEPWPNPNQRVGCCTGVAKCSQFNAKGNRVKGVVFGMKKAEAIYSENTKIDPWPGVWPTEDTGSSGLASAKTAQAMGIGGTYRWLFGGADAVVQSIMDGRVVSAGTWWYWDMFTGSAGYYSGRPIVSVGGGEAGGHQYVLRGYDQGRDLVLGRCWWGSFRDFWIKRGDLDALLRDGGDAHVQERVGAT